MGALGTALGLAGKTATSALSPWLLAGTLLPQGVQALLGAVQSIKGKKELNQLIKDYPQMPLQKEYGQGLGILEKTAQNPFPEKRYYENLIGESTARAMTGAKEGSISSNVYQGAVQSALDQELQALNKLALTGMQAQTQANREYAGGLTAMGQQKDILQQHNVNDLWNIKAQMAASKMGAAGQNLGTGISGMTSTITNYLAGTKYQNEMESYMNKLFGNG